MAVVSCPLFVGKFRAEMIVVRFEFYGALTLGGALFPVEVRTGSYGHRHTNFMLGQSPIARQRTSIVRTDQRNLIHINAVE